MGSFKAQRMNPLDAILHFLIFVKPDEGASQSSLNSLDHIFHNFLRITEDHHGFIHVEKLVV